MEWGACPTRDVGDHGEMCLHFPWGQELQPVMRPPAERTRRDGGPTGTQMSEDRASLGSACSLRASPQKP